MSLISAALAALSLIILIAVFNYLIVYPEGVKDYAIIMAISVLGLLGQFFFTLALKIEQAGIISLTRTIDIVMAFVLQAIFLNETTDWTSILGAILVCLCVVAVGVKKLFKAPEAKILKISNP